MVSIDVLDLHAVAWCHCQGKAIEASEVGKHVNLARMYLGISVYVQLLKLGQGCKSCKVCFCKDAVTVGDGQGLQRNLHCRCVDW